MYVVCVYVSTVIRWSIIMSFMNIWSKLMKIIPSYTLLIENENLTVNYR